MFKISDLRNKDIISLKDGRKLGPVCDIELDLTAGRVTALILPGTNTVWGRFSRRSDVIVPWSGIYRLGVDTVLVDTESTEKTAVPPADKPGAEDWGVKWNDKWEDDF